MRIKCSHCSGTFSVPEEKIAGRSGPVKVKCPSCAKVLQVKLQGSRPAGSGEKEWYCARGEKQEGPFTLSELAGLISSGSLAADGLVWKAGFADWKFVEEADELKAFLSGDGGTEKEGIGEAIEEPREKKFLEESRAILEELAREDAMKSPSGDGLRSGTAGGAAPRRDFSDKSAPSADESLFGSFGGDGGEPAEETDGEGHKFLHQRRDTSVLFSMDDLFGKADQQEKKEPVKKKDDSGLIDIRKMAIGANEEEEDLFGAFARDGGEAAPDLPQVAVSIPLVKKKKNWAAVAAISVVVLGVLVAGAFVIADTLLSTDDFISQVIPTARAEVKSEVGEFVQKVRDQYETKREDTERKARAALDELRRRNDKVLLDAVKERDAKLSAKEDQWKARISVAEAELRRVSDEREARMGQQRVAANDNGRGGNARNPQPATVEAENRDKRDEKADRERGNGKDRHDRKEKKNADDKKKKDRGDEGRKGKEEKAKQAAVQPEQPKEEPKDEKKGKVGAAALLQMIDKRDEGEAGDEGGAASGGKKTLTMSDVTREVKRNKDKMKDCFSKYGSGLSSARIATRITIDPSGSVSSVTIASREFAGTALGNCVKKVQMDMSFPPFSGAPVKKPISVLLP